MTTSLAPSETSTAAPRRRIVLTIVGLAVVVLAVVAALVVPSLDDARTLRPNEALTGVGVAAPTITVDGVEDGGVLGAEAITSSTVTVSVDGAPGRTVTVTLDGDEIATGTTDTDLPAATLAGLTEGQHELTVSAGQAKAGTSLTSTTLTFTVDTTPPGLDLPEVIEATSLREPLTVTFTSSGATEITAGDATISRDGDEVTATFGSTPTAVTVTARDEAGNTTTMERPVVVTYPGGRAVHTTPLAWQYEPKRTPIVELIKNGQIEAVQLDIKDESGDIGFDSAVELADLSGADDLNESFDVGAAIDEIHALGARVIGRLVVYRDPVLGEWAWTNGRRDMLIQTPDGQPYAGGYGDYSFTNFAHPDVQQYNIDIALEAVELGFDEILYDYIRRPDGSLSSMRFPGIGERTAEEAVVEIMADAYPQLREAGAWVGASVFGIAIDRPTQMAQDIGLMAPHVDYISPMVYPNHWGPGEYGVSSPEDAPGEIVQRSLADYQVVLEPTGTRLIPWLQDFGGYGEAEVRAQIEATEAVTGEQSFLLWASSATYTDAALDPTVDRR